MQFTNKNTDDVKRLVEIAFLSDADKDILYSLLKEEGGSEKFYKIFNDLLVSELKKRTDTLQDCIRKYEEDYKVLNDVIYTQRKKLEDEVQEKLADIEISDLKAKNIIWDEYYAKVESIQKSHEDQLHQLLAKQIIMAT